MLVLPLYCGIVNVDILMVTVVVNHDQHICHFTGLLGSAESCFEKQPSGFEKQLSYFHCLINTAVECATQLYHLEYPLFSCPVNAEH